MEWDFDWIWVCASYHCAVYGITVTRAGAVSTGTAPATTGQCWRGENDASTERISAFHIMLSGHIYLDSKV